MIKYSNLPVFGQFDLPHLPLPGISRGRGGGADFAPPGFARGGGNLNKYKSKGGQIPPLASMCGRP